MVAWKSFTEILSFAARSPNSSVSPTACPPFTPPPASHIVYPYGLWSRPLPPCDIGVRPNSLAQTTRVSFSSPRAFRSFRSPAIGTSTCPHIFSWLPLMSSCASHCVTSGPPPE